MRTFLLLLLSSPLWSQDFPVETLDKEAAPQGVSLNLDDKFSIQGGTIVNRVSLTSGTIRGDLVVDSSTLCVDATNNRVGIGTCSPTSLLHVTTSAASGSIASFSVEASSGFAQFHVPSVRARNSVGLSIPNATLTAITLDMERWDNDNMHDTASNTSRLTANTPGLYLATCHVRFDANGSGIRDWRIRVNGGATSDIAFIRRDSTGSTMIDSISAVYRLAAGDYMECYVYQDSGVTLQVIGDISYTPEFGMTYLGR